MSMTISSTKTVGEIALELPQATRIFESMKIDYCCGGDRPVGEACSSAGVDFENLARMLEDVGANEVKGNGAFDFQQATLTELIAHILDKHHVYTKEEMVRLESLSEKVISAHGGNHSELLAIRSLLQQLFADLRPHMFKEEQILFPFIVELEQSVSQQRPGPFAPFGSVDNPIRMMMMEHDAAGEIACASRSEWPIIPIEELLRLARWSRDRCLKQGGQSCTPDGCETSPPRR